MQRFYKFINLLLVLCMVMSMLPATSFAADEISLTTESNDADASVVSEGTFQGNLYQVFDLSMTWTEAKAYCESLGGHLVAITSAEEQAFIESLLTEDCLKKQYWLGGQYIDGEFAWVTGEEFSYANWDKDQPDHKSDENYLQIFNETHYEASIHDFTRFKWNDHINDNNGLCEAINPNTVGLICEFEQTSNTSTKDGTFEYLSYDNQVREYTYHYDESWFWNSSYTYQHDLTRMSLRVAMAAGDIRVVDGQADADGARPLKNLMSDLGFTYSEEYSHYPVPEYDSIGYGIGSKTITSPSGEEATLIMVAIRGSGYGVEWGGNFRVGTGIDHEGFSLAADQVINGIKNYLTAHHEQFQSTIKIWISGYSRAGATTNLVAAYLDDGFVEQLKPDNVYAFCFECPQNTTNNQASNVKYDNIVNIVNPIDFVPKVAMSAWDYSRFGTTYCLPSYESTANYLDLMNNMRTHYRSIVSYASDSIKDTIADEAVGQASTLDAFFELLASKIGTTDVYCADYQQDMIEIFANSLGGGDADPSYTRLGLTLLKMIIQEPQIIGSTLGLFVTIDDKDITNRDQLIELLEGGFNTNGRAARAHYMELCLAWLDSLDNLTLNSYNTYREVFINCPVDITVRDSNGEIVVQIINDIAQEIQNGPVAYLDGNGQKIIILPGDDEYDLELIATDDGMVTYTVTEYETSLGKTQRVVSYYEVAVAQDDELYGTIEDLTRVSNAMYSLVSSDGKVIAPTVTQTGSEVETYTVNVSSVGGGSVLGGGIFTSGEYAKVVATPDEEYVFDGWYIGNRLVSKDLEYRFLVDGDITISAVFVEKSTSHTMTYVEAIQATCCSTGILAHWHCSICGKDFSDSAGTIEIENVVIPIDPSNHVGETEIRDAVDATYTHNGYTGDTYCLSCGAKIASGSVIPRKDSGISSSGDGGSSVSTYTIKVGDIDHGDITADYKQAEKGTIVTLTLSPDDGYNLKSLTVLDRNNREIEVEKVSETEYTFEMPRSAVTVEALFALAAEAVEPLPFTDVTEESWYYDAVRYIYENSLMSGTSNTLFTPDLTTTRGMIVTILYRLEDTPIVSGGSDFTDVEIGQWYSDAIAWAAANNIVGGYGNGLFGPDDPITREQLAAILYRYAQYKGYDTTASADLSHYADLDQLSEWAQEAVAWANSEGIISGTSAVTLAPKDSATRAQAAAMMMRFCENITP